MGQCPLCGLQLQHRDNVVNGRFGPSSSTLDATYLSKAVVTDAIGHPINPADLLLVVLSSTPQKSLQPLKLALLLSAEVLLQ